MGSRRGRLLAVIVVTVLGSGPTYDAEDPAVQCVRRNLPRKTSIQTVRFVTRDRLGEETVTRAKVLGKLYEDGHRRVVTRFREPADVRGVAFLLIERDGRNDIFLYAPELRKTKRVSARAAGNSLFGTDFSYEDFERLQGLRTSSETTRQPDRELDGKPVYVLETRPSEAEESVYGRILTLVDPETCLPLKSESYEHGERPRKVLTIKRDQIVQIGEIWVAKEIVMRDVRDQTETRLIVESIEIDEPIPDKRFRQTELERHRD